MKFSVTSGPLRLGSVITIVVALWMLAGVADCCLVRSGPSVSHPADLILASPSGELFTNADHAGTDCTSLPTCLHAFAAAEPPLKATALVALGSMVVTAIVASIARRAAPTRPAAPGGSPVLLTGQDVLTRLCIARR